MNKTQSVLCLATPAILLLTACGADNDDAAETADSTAEPTADPSAGTSTEDAAENESVENEVFLEAEVTDVANNPIGTVTAAETEGGVRLSADVHSLTPGFRAIAVHEHGVCEIQSADQWGQMGDFNSAGAVVAGAVAEEPGVVEGEDELAETPGEGSTEDQGAEELARSERAGSLPNLMINDDGTGSLAVVSTGLSEELLIEDDGTAVVIYANPDHHGHIPERYAPYGPDADALATGDTGLRTACGVLEATD